jgi:hypothetical protein
MARTTRKEHSNPDHQEAVALLEEMAGCLGLPLDYVQDLAQKITGRPWEELDTAGAEAVVELLAEALHRHLSRSATPTA